MLKNLFRKREYVTVNRVYLDNKSIPNIPDGKWINCNNVKILSIQKIYKETTMFV